MATLPPIRSINIEDLKDESDAIKNMATQLNLFMNNIYLSLNGSLSIPENINGQIRELEFRTLPTYTTGGWKNIRFQNTIGRKAFALVIGYIVNMETKLPFDNAVTPTWAEQNGEILITKITGLENNMPYFMRLVIL